MNQITKVAENEYGVNITGMPMGLAIMFNDKLYDRVKQIAGVMARAEGFTPPHLIGKTEACFAVVTRAITWKLDPQAVAQSTYQTPGGRIGYEGKLIQAILENSGRLDGNVAYELIGDWSKINGNFEIKKSEKGKDYAVPKWTRADARAGGCGVVISAQVKGEAERRTLKFMLEECFPLNSTLWATRPSQQIKYTGCRAFGNTVAPGILMGEPFDLDQDIGSGMKDVTPKRPERADFEQRDISIDPAAKEPSSHNPETGEVTGEAEGPATDAEDAGEFGAFEAREEGKKARDANKPLGSIPPNIEQLGLGEAFQDGWRDRDGEILEQAKAMKRAKDGE
jgi:hypothetical protein